MKRFAGFALLILAGCGGGGDNYLPLGPGQAWSYSAQLHFKSAIADWKVTKATAVGDVSGWELNGDLGRCRLAWHEGRLLAAELSGTEYDPPLILASPGELDRSLTWTGRIRTTGTWTAGSATLNQVQLVKPEDQVLVAGKKYRALRTQISLTAGKQKLELTTWFVRGIGIVRQEQRVGEDLVPVLDYISGP